MNSNTLLPFRPKLSDTYLHLKADKDKMILDWLGNPKNVFLYSIKANGFCHVTHPCQFIAADLRTAVSIIIEGKK